MKKFLQHITLLVYACAVIPFGSCTSDVKSDRVIYSASDVGGEVDLSLNVRIANTLGMGLTRDGENTDNSYSFEHSNIPYELINTLRIIIVRPDNTIEYNRTISLGIGNSEAILTGRDDLKFRVSTDLGQVNNEDMTCTERKHIYLIANEASLNKFNSNIAGDGESITEMLDGLKPIHNISIEEGTNSIGDKLDPYSLERWVIYNAWAGGVDTAGETAVPIIDNTGTEKSYIPMTEYFDVDVVSTWRPEIPSDGEDTAETERPDEPKVTIDEQTADLFVTRNFVKFQFSASSTTESFDITAIRFESLMQKEYFFPCNTVYEPLKAVNNTSDRQIISFQTPGFADNLTRPYIFNPPSALSFIAPSTPEETVVPCTYAPQLYFCETHNYEANTSNLSLYKVGIDIDFYNDDSSKRVHESFEAVELPNLPYSLPRNTIVKVHFTIREHRKLDATVTVFPYTAVNLNPDFGFSPPESIQLTIAPYLNLSVGEAAALLTATVTPEDAEMEPLVWVASDPDIISLSDMDNTQSGASVVIETSSKVRVTPLKPGDTLLKVYAQNGLTAECKVRVK